MIHGDTIELLRECGAGVKMGVGCIDEVLDKTKSEDLKKLLDKAKDEHETLGNRTNELLCEYHDTDKDPNPIAKGMSWMKTNMKIAMEESDRTVADIVTDGCNMGVKSLRKYLNQYAAADEKSKDIAKELIGIEENLAVDLREYL